MPSYYDETYNKAYSAPTFDSEEDKKMYRLKREAEYIFERTIPRQPTR